MVNKNRNVITINLQGDIGEIFRDRELFIYQYDDGQELYFPDYEELGITEVQFANENSGEAIRREMTDGYVQIPYSLLSQNRPIFAYVMCITSGSTTTMIKLIIQNNCRVIAEDAIDPEDEQTFREWVQEQIDGKQDALTAGENITIENNVISATGGGRVNELDDLEDVDVASATNGQYLVYDNGEWKNADGMTESAVNLLIDNKLIPFSKVFNATTIRFDAQSFTLEIQIDTVVTSFKKTDIIILKLSNVTIPEGQCRRISVFNLGGQYIASYNFAVFPDLINGAFYLIRFDNGYADIISSSAITAERVEGLTTLLNAKQNTLTAGANITIVNDVISATGGGGGVDALSELADVDVTGVTDGQIIKWNAKTQKWESADEATTDLTNIPHVYTAYFLEQNLSTISVVINELSDNTVVPTASDFIIFTTISSDVFPNTTPSNIKFYASDEETLLATKSLRVVEQFMGGNNYELFIDGNTVRSLTDNVNSVAQVNNLIDAKISALGNAEEEEF